MQTPMIFYIVLSLVMFFAGVYGFITRKNMLMMLILMTGMAYIRSKA